MVTARRIAVQKEPNYRISVTAAREEMAKTGKSANSSTTVGNALYSAHAWSLHREVFHVPSLRLCPDTTLECFSSYYYPTRVRSCVLD